ncbi:hypothetical protein LXA43DRAFT_510297 [Ganoderma leucocontextum]|nr:hypothetical protein LXA43DRAFT_510297 [Ganoderma leucocontextum]
MGPVRCHALRVLVHVLSSTGCLPFSIKFLALSAPSRMHFLPLIHHTIALPPPKYPSSPLTSWIGAPTEFHVAGPRFGAPMRSP